MLLSSATACCCATGTVQSDFSKFSSLRRLSLNDNKLSGALPATLSPATKELGLNGNNFTGGIQ